jgi:hypothetical protein
VIPTESPLDKQEICSHVEEVQCWPEIWQSAHDTGKRIDVSVMLHFVAMWPTAIIPHSPHLPSELGPEKCVRVRL